MRAMVIDKFGGPEELHWDNLPVPQPMSGDVLVRVICASVNPADWKTREGMLSKYITYNFPFVLGFDVAEVVEAVGDGVTRFKKGDRVFGMSKQGAGFNGSYAEFTLADAGTLQPLPEGVTFAQAAALPVAGNTAYGALVDVGALKAGQKVLINGGAGGVGSYGIQIAKALNANVAVTCSPRNNDYVSRFGAELAIDYRAGTNAIAEAVRAWAPEGVDLVVDAVGLGSLVNESARLVKPGGSYVEIETLFPEANEETKNSAAAAGVRITSNMIAAMRIPQHLAGIADLAGRGLLLAPEIEIVPLDQVGDAHRRVQDGHVRGKVVLQVAAE